MKSRIYLDKFRRSHILKMTRDEPSAIFVDFVEGELEVPNHVFATGTREIYFGEKIWFLVPQNHLIDDLAENHA